jgi:lipopolysaccharide/colanic/teichoic acid biosynthesis glycosyltransferase
MVRRAVDISGALAGLVISIPLMLAIALAIRLDTPGSVLFSQTRLGRGGRHFRLYKFRKFRHGPDASGCAVTLKDDPRLTRVGRLLERWKFDELPQLWNVLVGDMSLVGPRPETLDFADCFSGPFRQVLDHTPGLFGPNQVIFRNEGSLYPADQDPHNFYRTVLFPEKARIDLRCFEHRSLFSDIAWIVRGALAVLGLPIAGVHLDAAPTIRVAASAHGAAMAGSKPSRPSLDKISAAPIAEKPN